jgi:phosphoribosylformimino-5-aminoimidazole carboxamide ribotide isomerase
MFVIPALDLLGHDAVRLEQGEYDKVIFRRPVNEILPKILALQPDLLHIVDLDGAREGRVRDGLIRDLLAMSEGVPLQVSGGIRNLEIAHHLLELGVQRVIVGTAAWATPEGLVEYTEALGDALVVAVDVRHGRVATGGWLEDSGLDVDDAVRRCAEVGVRRLHVTAISRDGTMTGPDLDLYRHVCGRGPAVVAAGGVRGDADLKALEEVGCEAAVMGLGLLQRLGLTT